jgi:diacylglycerol kinase family enzyme
VDDSTGRLFGRSKLDSGLLGAYVVRRRSALDLLRVGLRLARGQDQDPALSVFSGHDIEIRSGAPVLHVMIDGEVQVLPTPVMFSVRPSVLTVLAP